MRQTDLLRTGKFSLRKNIPYIAALAFPAVLLLFPGQALSGAEAGVKICLELLIPTLFPFLMASTLCTRIVSAKKPGRIVGFLLRTLFFLPGEAWPVLVFSLLGGYPVGAKTVAALQKSGVLTKEQSARLLLFCVNPGPAFVLTAVGSVLLRRPQAGVLLAGSVWGAGILLGILCGLFARLRAAKMQPTVRHNSAMRKPVNAQPAADTFSEAFVGSIADAGKSLLLLCGTVLIFSVLSALLAALPVSATVRAGCIAALEVTCGVRALCRAPVTLPVLAAFLSFGGLCVHAQVRACFVGEPLPGGTVRFFCGRLVHAGGSFMLCRVLIRLFPQAVPTFAGVGDLSFHAFSRSAPAAVALLMLVLLLLFSINLRKESSFSPAGVVE